MANEMKCNQCGIVKSFEKMRKRNGVASPQCNDCVNKTKKLHKQKIAELSRYGSKVEENTDLVKKRTFQFTPYIPEKHWVRNNGNVHIPSRGYSC